MDRRLHSFITLMSSPINDTQESTCFYHRYLVRAMGQTELLPPVVCWKVMFSVVSVCLSMGVGAGCQVNKLEQAHVVGARIPM